MLGGCIIRAIVRAIVGELPSQEDIDRMLAEFGPGAEVPASTTPKQSGAIH